MLIKKYKNKKVAKFATRRLRAFHPTSPGNFFMSQNTATATPFPHGVRLSVVVRDGEGIDNPGIHLGAAEIVHVHDNGDIEFKQDVIPFISFVNYDVAIQDLERCLNFVKEARAQKIVKQVVDAELAKAKELDNA